MAISRVGAPLYLQIFETLLGRIRSGAYGVGQQLPTEDELQAEFGVSRSTIRAALDKLVQARLVSRQSGKGTFVMRSDPRISEWSIGSVEDLINLSFAESYKVLSTGLVPASRHPAPTIFGPDTDGLLFLVRRLRSNAEGPYSCSDAWFSPSIGRRLPASEMTSQPLLQLVEQALGVQAVKAEQIASATMADEETATLLGMAPRSPILMLERTYFDAHGRVLEQARMSYRGDKYAQSVTFTRHEELNLVRAIGT